MNASCIIPIFNEKERIGFVIRSVQKSKLVNEIVCVDDGSTDGSAEFVGKNFKNVKVIKIGKNKGKANAVLVGAKSAKNNILLILDADLIKIESVKIDYAISRFIKENLDLIVFKMKNFFPVSKLLRHDILISGNYVIGKSDLIKLFQNKKPVGYELEIAINQYMMDNGKKVATVAFDSEGYSPVKKRGLVWAIKRDLKMYPDILRFVGLKNYIKQTLFFATK